jgi:uncharacterized membrane protein
MKDNVFILVLVTIIGIVALGTVIPSAVSAQDSVTVLIGIVAGLGCFAAVVYCITHLVAVALVMFLEEDKKDAKKIEPEKSRWFT